MGAILKIRNLSVTYSVGSKKIKALNNANFDLNQGEILGVVGESGSGKSTLIKGILNIEHAEGEVFYNDQIINNHPTNFYHLAKRFNTNTNRAKNLLLKFINKIKNSYEEWNLNKNHVIDLKSIALKIAKYMHNALKNYNYLSVSMTHEWFNPHFPKKIEENILKVLEYLEDIITAIEYNFKRNVEFKPDHKDILYFILNKIIDIIVTIKIDKNILVSIKRFFAKNPTKKASLKQKHLNKKDIQMVMQDPSLSLNERASINDILTEGIKNFKNVMFDKASGSYKEQERKLVNEMLEIVGLPENVVHKYQHELSGGQKQRISIVRSLLLNPKILIADEPISSLDVTIRAQILNLLKKFRKERNLSIIFIAHDLSTVRFFCDRIIVIYKGNIVEIAESNELFTNPIHPYTKNLLSSSPIGELDTREYSKEEKIYDNESSKYVFSPRALVEIKPNHFVYANKEEVKMWKKKKTI